MTISNWQQECSANFQLLWDWEKFQENLYFCFIDYTKAFDHVDHAKLWKILKETGVAHQLTCLVRDLYAGQNAAVRTGHGRMDWLNIGKGVVQGCMLSLCFFNFYAGYTMQNAVLDSVQAGLSIPGWDIHNHWYADDTTLMAESEEDPKSLLMKVKEEHEEAGIKLNILKTKIMAPGPITLWQMMEKQGEQWQSLFSWAPKSL